MFFKTSKAEIALKNPEQKNTELKNILNFKQLIMGVRQFEDLQCWQAARELVKEVYLISSQGLLSKDYSAQNQFRRAALSIMNNIAEGFGRFQRNDFKRFLEIANGSANEVKSMVYAFEDINYLSSEEAESIKTINHKVQNLLKAMMKSLIVTQ